MVFQVGRCVLIVLLLISGGATAAKQPAKLDLFPAVDLVRAWVFLVNPTMNPEVRLKHYDVTTPEIWLAMDAQLFAKTSESFVFLPDYFFIKNEQVYPIWSINFWCLLTSDQGFGEAFVYSEIRGSGIVHTSISAIFSSPDELTALKADLNYLGELSVSCEPNAVVALDVVSFFRAGNQHIDLPARLGTVVVTREHGSASLRFYLDPSAPPAIEEEIWN